MGAINENGEYTIEVELTGGSGKAGITSPASLTVEDGRITMSVEWSSSKYDLMIVGDTEYLPVNTEGNSVFMIPVGSLDEPLAVKAETIAMSEPHLIDYEITFDVSTLKKQGSGSSAPAVIAVCAAVAVCAAAAVIGFVIRRNRKNKSKG